MSNNMSLRYKFNRRLASFVLLEILPPMIGLARRILPRVLKQRLAGLVVFIDAKMQGPMLEERFRHRPAALAECRSLLSGFDFASGPVVLVNNALAAGGVERQIVNTLLGLQ